MVDSGHKKKTNSFLTTQNGRRLFFSACILENMVSVYIGFDIYWTYIPFNQKYSQGSQGVPDTVVGCSLHISGTALC